jgi:hypothetical protein
MAGAGVYCGVLMAFCEDLGKFEVREKKILYNFSSFLEIYHHSSTI